MKRLFKTSKWFHKYLGLALILFLMWESVSGIMMNHPELISDFSVPRWAVPEHYHVKNWSRSSLIKMIYSERDSVRAFACGKVGVWETKDGGKTFHSYMNDFPTSPFYKKTNDIFLLNYESEEYIFAATDGGLYISDLTTNNWTKIKLSSEKEKVKKILKIKNRIKIVTESNFYESELSLLSPRKLLFTKTELAKDNDEQVVTLVELFFHLHDGRILGLPGKLLFDLVGVIIFFLSISAFYAWYFPKRLKRKRNKKILLKKSEKKAFKFLFKYHLKLGIWAAAIMLIVAGTAFFMRPPMLAVIATGTIPAKWYPGFLPDNPWHEKIHTALYDPIDDKIILETTEGLYQANNESLLNFQKTKLNSPIFVMGPTVFDTLGHGGYLIGSFNGLFHLERSTGKPIDILTGEEAENISNVRPAEKMITGYFKTPQGEEFITAHEKGLLPIGNSKLNNRFEMPKEILTECRMPLWNYLFEIHNGRFFKGMLGGLYILLVPIGSLFFFIAIVTGVYDWFVIKNKKKK